MNNYLQAARERLQLWVSDDVEVRAASEEELEVLYPGGSLSLKFIPERCLWYLDDPYGSNSSDFDRLLKKVRQLLTLPERTIQSTSLPPEEEAR